VGDVRLEGGLGAEAKGGRGGEIRIGHLRDFVASSGPFERRTWTAAPLPGEETEWEPPTLHGFLQQISLFSDADSGEDSGNDGADQVTLMTMHGAKGLEFSHVFIAGLEEEILPHARSLHEVAENPGADPIAEERRLFYVGMTRARHRLTLSGCRTRRRGSESLVRQPSRFVKEIPADLLDVRTADGGSSLSEADRQELRKNFFSQMRETLSG